MTDRPDFASTYDPVALEVGADDWFGRAVSTRATLVELPELR